MADKTPNRVYQYTTSTGQGNVVMDGVAVFPSFFTAHEVGFAANETAVAVIEEGDDVEISDITVTQLSPFTFSRDSVVASRINGVAGTTKMNLGGSATVQFVIEGNKFDAKPGLSTPHTWAAVQGYAPAALTFNATQTWDVSANPMAELTLTGNVTSFSVSGVVAGRLYMLKTINGAGPYTIVYTAANFKFIGAVAPTATPTNGAVDYYVFRGVSSTVLHEIGRGQNVG